ncbi:hypothetical protein SSOG_01829 [Streptomyces himastatinicus ATCC 53653]|uniref:Uncharacterized protein n=1 Tax=Streptomyces himastatinicus ATCC 53653 TaxID=457427 RepID=D9WSH6_9ACTN|nr:hypothetical protein SSOG_01829 [Streptomyces himastatinicus ATCC 53653]
MVRVQLSPSSAEFWPELRLLRFDAVLATSLTARVTLDTPRTHRGLSPRAAQKTQAHPPTTSTRTPTKRSTIMHTTLLLL